MRARAVVAAALLPVLAVVGCSAEPDEVRGDPVVAMEGTFNGHPRQSEIRRALESAFAATDTAITDGNYRRAARALVTLRRQYGIDEMEILGCIPRRANDPRVTETTFAHLAGVCVGILTAG